MVYRGSYKLIINSQIRGKKLTLFKHLLFAIKYGLTQFSLQVCDAPILIHISALWK